MPEQKQVLYDLRTSYNGPFSVGEFYAEVDNWIKEKGFEKEPKKKLENITKNGRKIQYIIEAQSHLDELHHGVVVLRVLMDNVKEITVKRNGRKYAVNSGDVFVVIEGFIQSHVHSSFYQVKPVYYFIRALIDRYIYNFWSFKYDNVVNSDGRDLLKRITSFFNMQKYKYE